MRYEIIDDLLPQAQFAEIFEAIMSPDFPWYRQTKVTGLETEADQHYLDSYYFTHMLLVDYMKSSYFEIVRPVIERIDHRCLQRVKANLYPRTERVIHHGTHSDGPYPSSGAIFFLNTNDGATVLNGAIAVESVANRLLLFESSEPHNSTTCSNKQVRCNINFNFF